MANFEIKKTMANLLKSFFTLLLLLLYNGLFAQSDIIVSGSTFPANGTYTPDGTLNGKTYYKGPLVTYQYSIEWNTDHEIWLLKADFLGVVTISYFSASVDSEEPPAAGWIAGGPVGSNFSFYTIPTFTGGVSTITDEEAPTIVSLMPANGSANVSPDVNFTLTFDEGIKKGSGNINIYKRSGTLFQSIDIGSIFNSIVISGKTLSFKAGGLASMEGFYILIEDGAILDAYDNAFALTDPALWTFTSQEISVTVVGAGNPNFDGKYIASEVQAGKLSYVKGDYRIRYLSLTWIIENMVDDNEGVYISAGVTDLTGQAPHDVGWEPLITKSTNYTILKQPATAPGPVLSGYVESKDLELRMSYPYKDFADFPLDGVIEIRFNKAIKKGTGNIHINLNYSTDSFETIDVTGSNVTIAGKSLFIDPQVDFTDYQRYNIIFDNGVVEDLAGNAWAGIPSWNAGGIIFRAAYSEIAMSSSGIIGPLSFTNNRLNIGGKTSYAAPQGSNGATISWNNDRWVLLISPYGVASAFPFSYVNFSNTDVPPATGWEPMALPDFSIPTRRAPDPAPTLRGGVSSYVSNADVIWDGSAWSNVSGPSGADNVEINGTLDNLSADIVVNDLHVFAQAQLVISGNATLTVHGNLLNNGKLIIESGASLLTASGSTITGDVIIKRNTRFADGKYSFVGTPIKTSNLTTGYDIGAQVYAYNETIAYGDDGLPRWEDAISTPLAPGVGYAQAGQKEIIFGGIPNTGTITVSGTYTDDLVDANEGWNLVANPYPAALSVTEFLQDNSNTTGAVYIWDDNSSNLTRGSNSDYIVINASGATDNNPANGDNTSRFNDHLGTTQGFFVQLKNSTNTDIVFNEDQRVTGNNMDQNFFRKSNELQGRLRVNLSDEDGLFKQTMIAWNNEVDDTQINFMFDAPVFNQSADYVIYSYKLGQPLAIQTITQEKTALTVGMHVAESGNYILAADVSEYASSVLLQDLETEQFIDLSFAPYHFYAPQGSITNRFKLIFSNDVLNAPVLKQTKVFLDGRRMKLLPAEGSAQTFAIYSITGQYIMSKSIHTATTVDLTFLKAGIYLVKEGHNTTKIILN